MGKSSRLTKKRNIMGILMILPALILILVLLIYPLIQGISYGFTNYRFDRPGATTFTGLENFIKVLTSDKEFYGSLGFTIINALCSVLFSYIIGFGIALLLNRKVPGRGLFRALILIPWVVSSSVVATNWQWLLNDRYGMINLFLQNVLHMDPVLFFARPAMARFTVILIGAWKMLPFMAIVILAGLQSISPDYYEAAGIDGANALTKLRYITIPGVKRVSVMCTTLQFIWSFNNFDSIYLLTSGGPNRSTYTLPIYIYDTAFGKSKIGYAASIAVLVLIAMIVITLIRFRLQKDDTE